MNSITEKQTTLKLGQIVNYRWGDLDAAILDMDESAPCAQDCLKLIKMADKLLNKMADITAAEEYSIINAVKHQVRVFYFG